MHADELTRQKRPQFWNVVPNNLTPHPRSGHKGAANSTDFYIWGGYCPRSDVILSDRHYSAIQPLVFFELWRFNYATLSWNICSHFGDVPNIGAASCAVCLDNNILYVYGGTGYPFAHSVSNDLYACDLSTYEWKKLKLTGDRLPKAYGSSIAIVGNHLYILFGTNGFVFYSAVYQIDTKTYRCKKVCSTLREKELNGINGGRYRQEIAVKDNQIFVFGGAGSEDNFGFKHIPVFNTTTYKWFWKTAKPDQDFGYPYHRKFHCVIKCDDDVYMFGGLEDDQEQPKSASSRYIWKYNFTTNKWNRTDSRLPQRIYFQASGITENGQLFYHGGIVSECASLKRSSRLYSAWIKVPKLFDYLIMAMANKKSDTNPNYMITRRRFQLISNYTVPNFISRRIEPSKSLDETSDSDLDLSTPTPKRNRNI
ncbi:hypothetical protein GJ496_001089 [Pomphorhynchus laevis]|nr:hypothetical protein GJ496_001089 [Pomphorhynchus laevis]